MVYSIRGELAEELQRTPGLTLKPAVIQAPQWVAMLDQWDPKSPWHDRRVRLAANLAIDRNAINQAITLGHSKLTYSIIPSTFDFYWQPPAYPFDPAQAKKLLAEAGYPNGFDAGDYYLDISYANVQEAIASYLQQVGIRTKLGRSSAPRTGAPTRTRSTRTSPTRRAERSATRRRGSRPSSSTGGAYVYGSYPDIDALFKDQAAELDRKKREALLHKIQQLMHEKAMSHPDLGARVHQRPRPARAGVRPRPHPRPRLLGALRGREAQGEVTARRARRLLRRRRMRWNGRLMARRPAIRASLHGDRSVPAASGFPSVAPGRQLQPGRGRIEPLRRHPMEGGARRSTRPGRRTDDHARRKECARGAA